MKSIINKFKRLFIAIDLPSSVKEILFNKSCSIFSDINDAKITKKENIHLTLKFLGNLDIGMAGCLRDILKKIALDFFAFKFIVSDEIGAFPNVNKARVAFVRVISGNENIFNIYKEIENSIETLDINKELRKFEPHITIARFKNNIDISNKLISHKNGNEYEIECKKISLFESILNPKGPEYIILDEFILK